MTRAFEAVRSPHFPEPDTVGSMSKDFNLAKVWIKGIKVVLSLLLFTLLTALAGGAIKTFLDLRSLLSSPVEVALRHVIVDALILLAVVELFKTALTYFTEGRVKVTFIVDTILVVMLTEVISEWFKDAAWTRLAVLGGILLVLGTMRILAVRWSPTHNDAVSSLGIANE